MRHYANLIRAIPVAWLTLIAVVVAAVAGPFEDGKAAYDRRDYATAYRLWRPLADKGDAVAQYKLGGMYFSGEGVQSDDAEAAMARADEAMYAHKRASK